MLKLIKYHFEISLKYAAPVRVTETIAQNTYNIIVGKNKGYHDSISTVMTYEMLSTFSLLIGFNHGRSDMPLCAHNGGFSGEFDSSMNTRMEFHFQSIQVEK